MADSERWFRKNTDLEFMKRRGESFLPGLLGFEVLSVGPGLLFSALNIRPDLIAPNGYLHAATIVALADTSSGYGCLAHLPEGAAGFTTIELKTNFLGTATRGRLNCSATPAHLGRTTQVWDATIYVEGGADKPLALFRCTQMVLWPKTGGDQGGG